MTYFRKLNGKNNDGNFFGQTENFFFQRPALKMLLNTPSSLMFLLCCTFLCKDFLMLKISLHFECWGCNPWKSVARGSKDCPDYLKVGNVEINFVKLFAIYFSHVLLKYMNVIFSIFRDTSVLVESWQASPN